MTHRPETPTAPPAWSAPARPAWWERLEAPTWAVAIAAYAAWFALVIFHRSIPWPLLAVAGGYVLALHFSLQHEAIHSWRSLPLWLRTAVVWPPIGGWLPFEIYRRSHSLHHRDEHLTYPGVDTESVYHRPEDWSRYSPAWRAVLMANQTLLGRLVLGPWLRLRKLALIETGMLRRGDFSNVGAWLRFAAGLAVILGFVSGVCGLPVWKYYLLFVYPGMSLSLMRAFIEHRWGERPGERVASVESNWVFGLLFLWNNLHVAHHVHPAMPWYALPGYYRRNRQALLAHNGDYVFPGYAEIARRWLLRPVFTPVHDGI